MCFTSTSSNLTGPLRYPRYQWLPQNPHKTQVFFARNLDIYDGLHLSDFALLLGKEQSLNDFLVRFRSDISWGWIWRWTNQKPKKNSETIVNDTDDGRNQANQRLVDSLSHFFTGLYAFQVVVSSINSMGYHVKIEFKHFLDLDQKILYVFCVKILWVLVLSLIEASDWFSNLSQHSNSF